LEGVLTSLPTDAEQLALLDGIQRILDEGQFVATYKFALLLALVEISVERGDDTGGPLAIHVDSIAEKFIELYWSHTRPFGGGVLRQNTSRNISILGELESLQVDHPRLSDARRASQWTRAVRRVASVIRNMPLFRLQLLRGNYRLQFLYEDAIHGGKIVLKPGVAFCLRRFSTLIASLVRSAWIEEVRSNPGNAYLVGERESLETFLFGRERAGVGAIRDVLCDLQSGRCFYCDARIAGASHVDHFIPWASYPTNLGHNLVLAHGGCNGDKSDMLADVEHLDHWWLRNERDGPVIGEAMAQKGILTDLSATKGIATWAYSRAMWAGMLLWRAKGSVRPFPADAHLPFQLHSSA
jgi:hypothetical protein